MAETDDIKTLLQYAFEKPSTDFDGASADDIPYSLKLVYHAFHLKVTYLTFLPHLPGEVPVA